VQARVRVCIQSRRLRARGREAPLILPQVTETDTGQTLVHGQAPLPGGGQHTAIAATVGARSLRTRVMSLMLIQAPESAAGQVGGKLPNTLPRSLLFSLALRMQAAEKHLSIGLTEDKGTITDMARVRRAPQLGNDAGSRPLGLPSECESTPRAIAFSQVSIPLTRLC
jgi:hypothetical protein